MNVVEAVILVVLFAAAVHIAIQNFYTTTTGYVAVIEARTSLIADALASKQKALFKPNAPPLLKIGGRECLITPYYAECCGDVKYFLASGFPALLINATLYGYERDYYLLVPSPSYVIKKEAATAATPLSCVDPAAFYTGPASAFLVLPNGTVYISPGR